MREGSKETDPVPFVLDREPPQVTLLSPTALVTLGENALPLKVRAQDNVGVREVQLYAGTELLNLQPVKEGDDYTFTLNPADLPTGIFLLRVVVTDLAGNQKEVSLSVNKDRTPPTVVWLDPKEGAQVSGTVPLEVEATDNVGVAKVEFFAGSTKVGEATAAPFTFNWNTLGYPDGSVTLKARAVDGAGNAAEATLTVTVANQVASAFVITTPAEGDEVGPRADRSIVTITVGINGTLPPGVSVTRVEIYINGQYQGDATSNTAGDGSQIYIYTWDTTQSSPGHDPTLSGDRVITARVYYSGGDTWTNGVRVSYLP
ncbi:Ig-like domain-containing protein [Thermus sp. FJN-A]